MNEYLLQWHGYLPLVFCGCYGIAVENFEKCIEIKPYAVNAHNTSRMSWRNHPANVCIYYELQHSIQITPSPVISSIQHFNGEMSLRINTLLEPSPACLMASGTKPWSTSMSWYKCGAINAFARLIPHPPWPIHPRLWQIHLRIRQTNFCWHSLYWTSARCVRVISQLFLQSDKCSRLQK